MGTTDVSSVPQVPICPLGAPTCISLVAARSLQTLAPSRRTLGASLFKIWLHHAVLQSFGCKRRTSELNISHKLQLGGKKMLENSTATWIFLGLSMRLSDQLEKVQINQVPICTLQKQKQLSFASWGKSSQTFWTEVTSNASVRSCAFCLFAPFGMFQGNKDCNLGPAQWKDGDHLMKATEASLGPSGQKLFIASPLCHCTSRPHKGPKHSLVLDCLRVQEVNFKFYQDAGEVGCFWLRALWMSNEGQSILPDGYPCCWSDVTRDVWKHRLCSAQQAKVRAGKGLWQIFPPIWPLWEHSLYGELTFHMERSNELHT